MTCNYADTGILMAEMWKRLHGGRWHLRTVDGDIGILMIEMWKRMYGSRLGALVIPLTDRYVISSCDSIARTTR